jgi:hypothetical protein
VYAICDYIKLRYKCWFIGNNYFILYGKTYENIENQKFELNNIHYDELNKNLFFRDSLILLINFKKMHINKVADSKTKLKDYVFIL